MLINKNPSLYVILEILEVKALQVLLDKCTKSSLIAFIKTDILFYEQHNFTFNLIDADLEFKSIKELLETAINLINPAEHVYQAE